MIYLLESFTFSNKEPRPSTCCATMDAARRTSESVAFDAGEPAVIIRLVDNLQRRLRADQHNCVVAAVSY